MEIVEAIELFDGYHLWLVIIGVALLATVVLPRVITDYPFSMPMILLVLGYIVVALPFRLEAPDPIEYGKLTEYLTELGVIISLMGAGLKLDRKVSFKGWITTWRLLGITMVLTIILTGFLGWWLLAFAPATAVLFAAVIAPTDPVLASDVQVGPPGAGSQNTENEESKKVEKEDEIRFSLTSEAGLNDGLAFPFTNMAIFMAIMGSNPGNWLFTWFVVDVIYQIGIGLIIGIGIGYLIARFLLNLKARTKLAKAITGIGALAATLIIYGVTELLGGYGFIATFVGAIVIRNYERDHEYYESMHILIEKTERIFIAIIVLALGASVAGGLLNALSWQHIIGAILIIFLIRPTAGIIGLAGLKSIPLKERFAISFLGIKGIGSLYYLSYALNKVNFEHADELWATTALVIIISVFVHGITSTPIMAKLDMKRKSF